ncbi:hypothetical protein DOY81_002151 [Sarcophaga bullata]|nr:hypothetical protein DOY81_002151 [Sarcophaga bullata]
MCYFPQPNAALSIKCIGDWPGKSVSVSANHVPPHSSYDNRPHNCKQSTNRDRTYGRQNENVYDYSRRIESSIGGFQKDITNRIEKIGTIMVIIVVTVIRVGQAKDDETL